MAVKLDGAYDYLTIADAASLTPSGAFTAMCWVWVDTYGSISNCGICSQWVGAGNKRAWSLEIWVQGANELLCAISDNGAFDAGLQIADSQALPTGSWQHVAMVFVPSTSLTLYRNGNQVAQSTTDIPAAIHDSTEDIAIGTVYDYGAATRQLDGRVAEVVLIHAALAQPQIAGIYNCKQRLPRHYFDSDLKMYLPLMGPTTAAVNTAHWGCKDLSGNGNSVSSVNSAPVWADDPLAPQSWVDGFWGGGWAEEAAPIVAHSYETIFVAPRRAPGVVVAEPRAPGVVIAPKRPPGVVIAPPRR